MGRAVRESLTTPAESTTNLTLQTLLREGPLLRISACGAGGAGDVVNYTPKAWQQSGRSRCFTSVRVGRAVRETLSTTHLRRGSRVGGAAASHQCVWGGRRRRPPADTTSLTLQTLLREGPLLRISACGAGGAGEPSNTSRKHYKPYFTNLAAGGAAASHQCVWGMRCGRARRHNQQTLQTLL